MLVIALFNETKMIQDLSQETIFLIHCTLVVPAIKKLIATYDHLDVVEKALDHFKGASPGQPIIWDMPMVQELEKLRRELVVYHRQDFKPAPRFDTYASNFHKLLLHAKKQKILENTMC
jgi:hypothetical protein